LKQEAPHRQGGDEHSCGSAAQTVQERSVGPLPLLCALDRH
jgi:hypothetical protein